MNIRVLLLSVFITAFCHAQDVTLLGQFNGNIDFTMIGNTLNITENGTGAACDILTSSSATLNLDANDEIEAAYLYWAGSGTGDFEVQLNNVIITPDRTFINNDLSLTFFGAFKDVTQQVQNTGNGTYTLSDLDLTSVISNYCSNATNFGGWAIIIVYENDSLPINQINIYDGLESVSSQNQELTIEIDNLNVLDNLNSKIGFLAWEGDEFLAVKETLRINGQLVGNPPLNPPTNAFNGTNSFTGAADLFNMDLDIYDLENFIDIGDTEATIQLTSGQDFVMINSIVTKFNTELPDATVSLNNYDVANCNDRIIEVDLEVFNSPQAQTLLPANTPISIFADDGTNETYLVTVFTDVIIPVNSSIEMTLQLTIPENVNNNFTLVAYADQNESGDGTILEFDEDNNTDSMLIMLPEIPVVNQIDRLLGCDEDQDGLFSFDTSQIESSITSQSNMEVFYFDENGNPLPSPLPNPFITASQIVTVRVENPVNRDCHAITSVEFSVIPLPDFDIFDNALCLNFLNEPVKVHVQNGVDTYNYQWENALGEIIGSNSDMIIIGQVGTYSVTASDLDDGSCSTTKTFEIIGNTVSFQQPDNLLLCDEGNDMAIFNLNETIDQITTDPNLEVSFFESEEDLIANQNEIFFPDQFENSIDPQVIYARVENNITQCFEMVLFELSTYNCLPVIPDAFTPNGDDDNDTLNIDGLYTVFPDFEIYIYNRYGNLVFEGNDNKPPWDGTYKGEDMPVGTYFYRLYFNDPLYSPMRGWIYLMR